MVKRVCFISQCASGLLDPECGARYGGAELQMVTLAKALAADPDYEVHFVVESDGPIADHDGLTIHQGPSTGWAIGPWNLTIKRIRWVLELVTKPLRWAWVLHKTGCGTFIHSCAGGVTGLAALYALLPGKRFVYRLASDDDLDGCALRPFERRLYVWGMRHADTLFARSDWQVEQLQARHRRPSVVLRNGFLVPPKAPTAPKRGVLWVASAQNLKRPDAFVELARALPDADFRMVMPNNDAVAYERVIAAVAQTPNIDFTEYVPSDEIQRLFDEAAVFVNTSTHEGFPNTFVQAAMGATPIVSLVVNPDDVLGRNDIGIACDDDFDTMVEAVRRLLEDDGWRDHMGQNAFEYARANHDIAAVIRTVKSAL